MRRVALLLVVLAVLAAGGFLGWNYLSVSPTSTTAPASSTTSTAPVRIAPLTGLADPDGLAFSRPAMTVKIENVPAAMPQRGIDQADVIYEEIVEGGITRLAAIFNSHAPAVIGPIRSVRRTDRLIVWPIGGLFVYSGGAAYAVRSIDTAPAHLVDEDTAGAAMFRDDVGRVAPDNLYGRGPALFALGGTPVPPPPLFTYRAAGVGVSGPRVASFVVGFGAGYTVSYDWNATTHSWDRTAFVGTSSQQPDVTWGGVRLSPRNVIVQDVQYPGGVGEVGAQAQMVGSGRVSVFTDGREVVGTWHRATKQDVTTYLDAKGRPISMTPGQTWVELLYVGDPLSVTRVSVPTTTSSTAP